MPPEQESGLFRTVGLEPTTSPYPYVRILPSELRPGIWCRKRESNSLCVNSRHVRQRMVSVAYFDIVLIKRIRTTANKNRFVKNNSMLAINIHNKKMLFKQSATLSNPSAHAIRKATPEITIIESVNTKATIDFSTTKSIVFLNIVNLFPFLSSYLITVRLEE